jgi:hypothetical protein
VHPKWWLLLLALAFSVAADAEPQEGYLTYSSVARARRSTEVLYRERHVVRYRQGRITERVVLYTCHDGSAFARKTLSYRNALAPDFLLENASDGMRQGIRDDAGEGAGPTGRSVFYRERGSDPETSGPVPPVPGLVADAGFDEFVQTHWDALMDGRTLELRFLLPTRLAAYGFQVQRLRSNRIRGSETQVFRLRLSGLWGWFLPEIDVTYRTSDRVLVRYDGISDLHDPSGNNYRTTIEYPVAERAVATAEAMVAARQSPIAPCRQPR